MSSEKGLRVLDAYGFRKKTDDTGDFNEGRMLYYRKIMDNLMFLCVGKAKAASPRFLEKFF
nr:hypothetical protein [uncultured Allomuricauda sp.]